MARGDIEERFWAKVAIGQPQECWLWTAGRRVRGYGVFALPKTGVSQRFAAAHRMAYELTYGPIPVGAIIMHKCDSPSCVNPAHLRLGTLMENVWDAQIKGRMRIGAPFYTERLLEEMRHDPSLRKLREAENRKHRLLVKLGQEKPETVRRDFPYKKKTPDGGETARAGT